MDSWNSQIKVTEGSDRQSFKKPKTHYIKPWRRHLNKPQQVILPTQPCCADASTQLRFLHGLNYVVGGI